MVIDVDFEKYNPVDILPNFLKGLDNCCIVAMLNKKEFRRNTWNKRI